MSRRGCDARDASRRDISAADVPAAPWAPPPGLWTLTVGADPAVVHVAERPPGEGAVHARWYDPTKTGADRRCRRSLGLTIRDASGELDPALVEEAEARAHALHAALFPSAAAGAPPGGWLALGAGMARALADGGAFAGAPDHLRTVRRYGRALVSLLGADTAWADLDAPALRRAWRLARDGASDGPLGGPARGRGTVGRGAARGMFDVLFGAAAWLRAEHLIPPGAAVAPRGWRRLLAADWEAATPGSGGEGTSDPSTDPAAGPVGGLPQRPRR